MLNKLAGLMTAFVATGLIIASCTTTPNAHQSQTCATATQPRQIMNCTWKVYDQLLTEAVDYASQPRCVEGMLPSRCADPKVVRAMNTTNLGVLATLDAAELSIRNGTGSVPEQLRAAADAIEAFRLTLPVEGK